ncbi:uncharacterized protein LOC132744252 [Ruditapes philippinarum]|uniref:uncharacterized protein LOC132744252 n=1 Tax=Ruditapes philippinarum TaxID=129788 RepID=UPI00295B5C32|nr:uncharacterized protein LOC132744252 [Ruditapes philippinarum]
MKMMIKLGTIHTKDVFLLTTVFAMCVFLSLNMINKINNERRRSTNLLKKPSHANEVQLQLTSMGPIITSKERFRILWYNPPGYLTVSHKDALHCGFEQCKYNNCDMTLNTSDADISQAVIFDGRKMPRNVSFTRPNGQIWIFAAHESPISYGDTGTWWYRNKDYSFQLGR